jgi:hypothetical protein
MNPAQRRRARVAGASHVAVVFAAAILIVWAALEHQPVGAAVAVGILIATFVGHGLSIAVLGVAVGTQQWIAVVIAAIDVAADAFQRYVVPRGQPEPVDEAPHLAAVITMLPPELVRSLAASAGPGGIVDTPAVMRCAIRADPTRWAPLTPADVPSRTGSEGGLIAGNWTLCAAEAALVAICLDKVDVDLHRLAGAAVTVPNSACGKDTKLTTAAAAATGYGVHHLVRALQGATKQPGGWLIMPRIEMGDRRSAVDARAELTDRQWHDLRSSYQQDLAHRAEVRGSAAPPVPINQPIQASATPMQAPRLGQRVTMQTSAKAPAARGQHSAQAATGRRKGRHVTRGFWAAARTAWPAAALISWWALRPACTLAALALSAAGLFGDHPASAGACLAIALVVRPARTQWLGCAAAVAAWWLVPPVGALIAARTLAGSITLLLVGPGFRAGTQSLIHLRQRLTGTAGLDEAWTRLEAEFRTTEDADYLDYVPRVLLAAWSTASFPAMVMTAVRTTRGVLTGRWPFPNLPGFGEAFLRLHLIEEAIDRAILALTWLTIFFVVWLAIPGGGHTVFGFRLYDWVAAACAACYCARLGTRGPIRQRLPSCILLALITFLASGHQAAVSLGVATGVALAGVAARDRIEAGLIAGRVQPPRRLGGIRSLAVRDRWIAACRALEDDRLPVARQLWRQIARDGRLSAPTRAGALAALADLAVRTGELQLAIEHAAGAVELADTAPRSCGAVFAAAGRISLAAGDTDKARHLMHHPAISRRDRRDARYAAARAELMARDHDAERAMAQLESGSVGLLRSGRLEDLIALEVTVLSRMLASAQRQVVLRRLASLISFNFDEIPGGPVTRERLAAALAKARILLGRLQLEQGEQQKATATLRRAVADLGGPREVMEQATARIMLGAATAAFNQADALQEMSSGIDQMEQARGALRAGQHRSQLLARHATIYELALDALATLQNGDPRAGWLAAQLCESLCRSALAQTLRRGELGISPEGRELLASIAGLEAHDDVGHADDLAGLRQQLQGLLSAAFATAYLPDAVDFRQLRRRLGSAHALSYRVHAATATMLRGHVVWTAPGKAAPQVSAFCIDVPAMLEVLGLRGADEREAHMRAPSLGEKKKLWRDLGEALLPAGIRAVLRQSRADVPEHIVVVPDGQLTVLPWAALRLDDDRFLAEAASLQYVPTLDMLHPEPKAADRSSWRAPSHRAAETPGAVVVYLDPAMAASQELQLIERFHDVALVMSIDQLCANLATGQLGGAYIAAHGEGTGLDQHVTCAGSGRMSAAAALGYPWPAWTIFASCLVGGLVYQLGEEPLGLPVSCLIGGAHSVIGGVIHINDATGGRIAASVAARLESLVHPADALCGAQLGFLGSPPRPAAAERWAGYVCLSRSVPARCHSPTHNTAKSGLAEL